VCSVTINRLLQLVDLPMLDMLRSHDLGSHDLNEITMHSSSKRPRVDDPCDLPQNILTAMKYLRVILIWWDGNFFFLNRQTNVISITIFKRALWIYLW